MVKQLWLLYKKYIPSHMFSAVKTVKIVKILNNSSRWLLLRIKEFLPVIIAAIICSNRIIFICFLVWHKQWINDKINVIDDVIIHIILRIRIIVKSIIIQYNRKKGMFQDGNVQVQVRNIPELKRWRLETCLKQTNC